MSGFRRLISPIIYRVHMYLIGPPEAQSLNFWCLVVGDAPARAAERLATLAGGPGGADPLGWGSGGGAPDASGSLGYSDAKSIDFGCILGSFGVLSRPPPTHALHEVLPAVAKGKASPNPSYSSSSSPDSSSHWHRLCIHVAVHVMHTVHLASSRADPGETPESPGLGFRTRLKSEFGF